MRSRARYHMGLKPARRPCQLVLIAYPGKTKQRKGWNLFQQTAPFKEKELSYNLHTVANNHLVKENNMFKQGLLEQAFGVCMCACVHTGVCLCVF